MKIDVSLIENGSLDEQILWICEARKSSPFQKWVKHVPPMRVIVKNKDVANKDIYYSNSCFFEVNEKNEIKSLKKHIQLYDNTGYRSYKGVALSVFDNEVECIQEYKEKIQNVIDIERQALYDYVLELEKTKKIYARYDI